MNKNLLILLVMIYFLFTYEPYDGSAKGIVLIGAFIMSILTFLLYFISIVKFDINVYKNRFSFDPVGLFFIWILIVLILISGIMTPKEFENIFPLMTITLLHFISFGMIISQFEISIVNGIKYFSYFGFVFGLLASIIANIVYWYDNINYGFLSIGIDETYERAYSWFANPNYLGNMLSISILCNYFLINKNKHWLKNLFLVISLPFLIITLLLTGSKAGLSAAIMGLILYIILINRMNFMKFLASKQFFLSLMLGIVVIIFLIYVTDFSHYIEDVLRLGNEEEKRLNYWLLGIDLFFSSDFSNMLIGNGYNFMWDVTGSSAHNTYIELLVNQGIIFLSVMLAMLIYISVKSSSILKGKGGLYTNSFIQVIFLMLIYFSVITTVLFDLRFEYYMFLYIFTLITFSKTKKGKQNLL